MPKYNIYTTARVVSLYTVEADNKIEAELKFDDDEAIFSHEVTDGSGGFVDSEEEIIKIEEVQNV